MCFWGTIEGCSLAFCSVAPRPCKCSDTTIKNIVVLQCCVREACLVTADCSQSLNWHFAERQCCSLLRVLPPSAQVSHANVRLRAVKLAITVILESLKLCRGPPRSQPDPPLVRTALAGVTFAANTTRLSRPPFLLCCADVTTYIARAGLQDDKLLESLVRALHGRFLAVSQYWMDGQLCTHRQLPASHQQS